MKKGLLIYPTNGKLFNIGDYVQSLAAKQFVGEPDALIDRESLNQYQGTDVKLIMNGWYMHNPSNWPPNSAINPLFVAFHLNKLAKDELLSPEKISYLKRHEPIGCRDFYTRDLLLNKGIEAYFSGCLTLTLGETYKKREPQDNLIYFTDVDFHLTKNLSFVCKCFLLSIFKYRTIKSIGNRKRQCNISSSFKQNVAFYATYSKIFEDDVLLQATYVQQEIENNFESEESKFQYADRLIRNYLKAQYVVTSRIHCALPCLAMGVPVLFVYPKFAGEIHNCRFDGLLELFNTIEIDKNTINCKLADNKKIGLNFHFENKPSYRIFAESLKDKCRNFFK